jgi:uncharacterized repeat protein (TIGR03803 family)
MNETLQEILYGKYGDRRDVHLILATRKPVNVPSVPGFPFQFDDVYGYLRVLDQGVTNVGKMKAMMPIVMLIVLFQGPANAQVFTSLENFNGSNGATPVYMTPIEANDGNLYGTTVKGGTHGGGVVFQMTLNGQLKVVRDFCYNSTCPDGSQPYGGVIQATDGNLYGTTAFGGGVSNHVGTVFRMTLAGKFTVLHQFCQRTTKGICNDGSIPLAAPVEGADGKFYLVTNGSLNLNSEGTAVRISKNKSFEVLCSHHNHCLSIGDMEGTESPLIQAKDGFFYGVAAYGSQGNGTIFKFKSGKPSVFHNFCSETNCADGQEPIGPLVIGIDGNFYGTTFGMSSAHWPTKYGTVFSITPTGKLTTLYRFCRRTNCADGASPASGLVQGTDGNFYGTTTAGGANNDGTIFKINPQGVLTVLHSFSGSDGSNPIGGLIQASNGLFYGATSAGGSNNDGTIFSLDMGLR